MPQARGRASAGGSCMEKHGTPDGLSPSQLFCGRRQRQRLPLAQAHTQTDVFDASRRDKSTKKAEELRNRHTKVLPDLRSGEEVFMQSHLNGRWDKQATVVNKRSEGDSYIVRGKNGQEYIRGRRLLKPISDEGINSDQESKEQTSPTVPKMPRSCLLYTSPSPRDLSTSRMPSSA